MLHATEIFCTSSHMTICSYALMFIFQWTYYSLFQSYLDTSPKQRKYIIMQEKAMAPHSSTPAWKIPWMEDPGGLQSMGSLRVGPDWATFLSLSCTGEGNGNPLHCSCLENPRDGGAWWAAVYGVAQSRTRLKRLSSSSSSIHSSIIDNSQEEEAIQMCINGWMDK